MAKNTSQSQAAFSFLNEVDKVDPLPKPQKSVLRPPAQIEVEEESNSPQTQTASQSAVPDVSLEQDHHEASPEETPVLEEKILEEPEVSQVATNGNLQERKSSRGRKSVKEHSLAAEMIEMPNEKELYTKQYYSMGEVTAMFKESHSLIRYWESEFDILRPKKNGKGDRFFRPVDVKNLYLIYDLLRRRKFTIEGARDYLKNNKKAEEKFAAIQTLERIKTFFTELKASL